MAESSRDTQLTKPEAEKKPPEAVQLTDKELKAIVGGASVGNPVGNRPRASAH
jgi:bacteriocin-like protein